MKKNITIIVIIAFMMIASTVTFTFNKSNAVSVNNLQNTSSNSESNKKDNSIENKVRSESEGVISNQTESTLVELKEKELKSVEDYQDSYGSKAYGLTAYILHKVQIYSIPFCFLGIIIGAINQYVLGIRHLEANEKGLALMVTFVTLAIICQVLPLIFTIVVKFGRE